MFLSYGDVTIPVTNEYGSTLNISFFRPELVPTYVTVNITPLSGYTTEVGDQIKQAIIDYYSNMKIGDNLYNSQLWEAALSVSPDVRPYFAINPAKGITVGLESGSQSNQNLTATFKQKFTLDSDNITIATE